MDEPHDSSSAPDDRPIEPGSRGHSADRREHLVDRLETAAVQAEFETGRRESTEAEAKLNIAFRLARIFLGFVVVIIGIVLLPLPGPGWVIIAGGFVILSKDFAWADRTVRLIRRKVPGVPEDGRIPARSWIMIGGVTVAAALIAFFFGETIQSSLNDAWSGVVAAF